jgi:hypothetical protein
MANRSRVWFLLCLVVGGCGLTDDVSLGEATQDLLTPLPNPDVGARFAPADYDGDGFTDLAVKGSNGVWYIDVAQCADPQSPNLTGTPETNCWNYIDDDNDGFVNDGCPVVGSPEVEGWACLNGGADDDGDGRPNDGCPAVGTAEVGCADSLDDDGDGVINDGCPLVGSREQDLTACTRLWGTVKDEDGDGFLNDGCPTNPGCMGPNGFGERWDFAYEGYGDNSAIPIPGDYGSTGNGPADGKADIAIKVQSGPDAGMFAIDYADNGFGKFDEVHYGYGGDWVVPMPADFDGDGKMDFAMWTANGGTTYGEWYFDYSSNQFGGWDIPCGTCPCVATRGAGHVSGYGTVNDLPAVGKFDGDACADLSIKNVYGDWYFDLTANGFGWDSPCPGCPVPLSGYGDSSVVPIVADYDGDGITDLAVKTPDAYWRIDFAAGGFGAYNTGYMYAGWAGSSATLVAGHFASKTGNRDLGVKGTDGNFYVDVASNGWGNLDLAYSTTSRQNVDNQHAHITATTISTPTPPFSCGVLPACNVGEDCVNCARDCGVCGSNGVPFGGNYYETPIAADDLKVGVRYTANVTVEPGTQYTDLISVMTNPDLRVSPALNVENTGGHMTTMVVNPAPVAQWGGTGTRRLGFTCSEQGYFPLGFLLNREYDWAPLNPDNGIWIRCSVDQSGLYGTVTSKRTKLPVANATVKVNGVIVDTTDDFGKWSAPQYTSGSYTVEISKPNSYWPAIAVNVNVPGGIQIDTPLEDYFSLGAGITYTTYIDYSRGRSILNTVAIDVTQAPITLGKTGADPNCTADQYGCGGCWDGGYSDFRRLIDVATQQNAPVMMNGIWWMNNNPDNYVQTGVGPNGPICETRAGSPPLAGRAIGYIYINGFVNTEVGLPVCGGGVCFPGEVACQSQEFYADPNANRSSAPRVTIQDRWQSPMFTVAGTGTQQVAKVIMTPTDFAWTSGGPWKRVAAPGVPNCPAGKTCPIYDVKAPTNQSDFTYAFQMGIMMLRDVGKACNTNADCSAGKTGPCVAKRCTGLVIARGVQADAIQGEYAIARTSVGTSADGKKAWFMIADGEGIDGANGATLNEMAELYRTLGASDAMWVDSGESTELILKTALGQRSLNTLTSETNGADGVGPSQDYCPNGRVFAYIKAGL